MPCLFSISICAAVCGGVEGEQRSEREASGDTAAAQRVQSRARATQTGLCAAMQANKAFHQRLFTSIALLFVCFPPFYNSIS